MRLDLVSEKPKRATVRWPVRNKYRCWGVTSLGGNEYKVRFEKTRFGGGVTIYPMTQYTPAELDASRETSIPLPPDLELFIGDTYTLDGAQGGELVEKTQGIEVLDELPAGYEGIGFRQTLYRALDPQETIAIFGALGYKWGLEDFEDFEAIAAARRAGREA